MPNLLVEYHDDVTLLVLNRPAVHNTVDQELAIELAEAINAFAADHAARVLVITGHGDTAFCVGASLTHLDDLWEHPYTESAGPMGFGLLDAGKPTIAAINGWCLAGGVELACWCDIRVVAEHARIGLLNKRYGVPLANGGTQRLPRIVGQGNALWMLETGILLDAHRAQLIGLAQEVVPYGQSLDRAMELARHIARPAQAGQLADRSAALASFDLSLADGLQLEAELALAAVRDPEVVAARHTFDAGSRPEPPRPRDVVRLSAAGIG